MTRSFWLMARLFIAYFSALLIGTVFIIINNVVFNQLSLQIMLQFHIPFLLISDLGFALVLLLITWWRLYPFLRSLRAAEQTPALITRSQEHEQRQEKKEKERVFQRLLRFPYELFVGVIGIAIMFILLFHGIEIWHLHAYSSLREGAGSLLISISSELSLTCIVATVLFSFSRAVLRPHLLRIGLTHMTTLKRQSILRQIYVSAIIGCTILLLVSARLSALMMQEQARNLSVYVLVLGFYLLFVLSMFILSVRNWRRDLAVVYEKMRLLADNEMMIPMQGIPIFSNDETASLALAFNQLQTQLTQMHGELAQQLAVAREVQQRLLPAVMPTIDQLQLAAYCQPCYEVGGDFYDVIRISETKLLVAIGDISGKGMSAAMLMSAMLAALRMEAAKGGSLGEILTRLNEQIYQITQGRSFVTVGLAVIDCGTERPIVQYSSAGHMSPYLLSEGTLYEFERAAIPLGMIEDQNYSEVEQSFKLYEGQLFIMYTDGVVEALDAEQQMFGFERWERELLHISVDQSLPQTLQQLLQHLPQAGAQSRSDDRTILLVLAE